MSNSMIVKRQQELLESMAKVTREVASKIVEKKVLSGQFAALVRYDCGALINEIYVTDSLSDAQKRAELQKLANYLGRDGFSVTQLTDMRNVALCYTRDYVKDQVSRLLPNGRALTFSHFQELQKISSESRRDALLEKVRKQSLSASELANEIASKKEGEIKRNGGRKPGIPKSPNAMLQKLINNTKQTGNYLEALIDPFAAALEEISPESFDETFIGSIDEALAQLEVTEKQLKATEERLKKAKSRASKKPVASAAKKKAD